MEGQKRLLACAKRGYSRLEAAAYVGVSTTKFDQLVTQGALPPPKQVGGRKIWDVRELDPAFEELGSVDTTWDDVRENPKIPARRI